MKKLYAERNPIAQDKAGNYYCRHVHAMTAERLHDKSDIASELAHRDMEIDRLRKDAERYRWLREHFRFTNDDSLNEILFDETLVPDDAGVPADLDQEIDAAMNGANTELSRVTK